MTNLASLDGTIGPADEMRIPVTDEGLLRGDGAFEVMRLYGGRPFALADHLVRLRRSCDGCAWRPVTTRCPARSTRCSTPPAPLMGCCGSC